VTPSARATLLLVLFSGVPALVLGSVLAVAAGPIVGLVVLVVVAAGLAAWIRAGADRRVLTRLGGRDADPKVDSRLCNLVEGLSTGAGIHQPRLRVVEASGLNAMAAGVKPARAVVGVTSALLTELDRVELEAVLAEQLTRIRRGETGPLTMLAATFGLGRAIAVPGDRDALADQAAVALTRYPPGLASALEKIDSKGAAVAGQSGGLADLWMVDPGGDLSSRGRLPLAERIEALREL
jgi:heat shock protein HtpX